MGIIVIEKDISEQIIEKNAEILKMAQLNLSDFNERMGKNYDLIFTFKDQNPRFFLRQELRYPDNTNTIASQINWLIRWKKEINDKSYFKIFFNDIERDFDKINRYHSPYIKKDNVYHKIASDFKKKYTDYAPLGFLDRDDEHYIKEEIKKRFLNKIS
ncbi:hypothetical protein PGH12_01940 [Chryseobacterium wangxinyae]|uniref:hypothetical protein n=1 Tax=Chryseobacterium sp. CY350 TaxID=2997336 RepID=UPI002270C149|nr:hypothetical protein [Chryseobacterium sp. CY350]MCY0979288.1 hypothetical protein [Chryseobacterium sp. CY350]WBZ95920.1 hypothetical protein PGH12_01940 [Chryseobacterium sp. CY350]